MASDPNIDLFSDLQSGGEIVTAPTVNASESFVRKCLHPPSAVPGFEGLPTNDARTQVLLQYSNVGLNRTPYIDEFPPTAIKAATAADLATYNYAILCPNGLRVNGIPFIYTPGFNGFRQDYNNVDIQDAYDVKQFPRDAQLYRPAYKSLTLAPNVTAFNDTGLISVNQFNPDILFAGTLLAMALSQPQHFYTLLVAHAAMLVNCKRPVHVHSKHVDYPKHAEQFAKWPLYVQDEIIRKLELPDGTIAAIDPNTTIQVVSLGSVGQPTGCMPVPTPSQLMNQSLRAYTGKFRDGAFVPQRLNTIDPEWVTSGNTTDSVTENSGLYHCWIHSYDAAGTSTMLPLFDNSPIGPTAGLIPLYDTLWSKSMTWSMTVIEGMSLNSQTSTSMQTIMKKYYIGAEVKPAPKSGWSGLTRIAPKPNLMAMQAAMDGFFELKDGMPAKYNFLGVLGTLLGPTALKLGGSALSWLTDKITKSGEERVSSTTSPRSALGRQPKVKPAGPSKREVDLTNQLRQMRLQCEALRRTRGEATAQAAKKARARAIAPPKAQLTKAQKAIRERATREPIPLSQYMRLPVGQRP